MSQERLRRLMSPFLMRRLKSEVAQDLPQNVDQEQSANLAMTWELRCSARVRENTSSNFLLNSPQYGSRRKIFLR